MPAKPISILDLSIPIHCLEIGYGQSTLSTSKSSKPDLLILGGGGGPGKTGLTNKLCCLDWDVTGNLINLKHSGEFSYTSSEDAPWSIAMSPNASLIVAGVNANETEKTNRNCRVLSRKGLFDLKQIKAFVTTSPDLGTIDFQTAAKFSPNGTYLATGSDMGVVSVLNTSGFTQLDWAPVRLDSKIYTICFTPDSSKLIVTSKTSLLVYQVDSGNVLLDVKPPPKHTFRAGLLSSNNTLLYTVVNHLHLKSILHIWDLNQASKPIRSVAIANKPAVSFTVCDDIAVVGLVDCSLVVMKAFKRVCLYTNAHDVPATALGIVQSPLGVKLIVSGSGDGQVKLWSCDRPRTSIKTCLVIYLPILILASFILFVTAWVGVSLLINTEHLVQFEIPFWTFEHGSIRLVSDHVPWLNGMDLPIVE